MGQMDALKVSGGVDLLQQLRELRLQDVHLETGGPIREGPEPLNGPLPPCWLAHLQVVLQVVYQEGHVVAESPLNGVRLAGSQVFPLHLQSPAVLQLRLHAPHAQQVPEHHIVPERNRGQKSALRKVAIKTHPSARTSLEQQG